ncbi:MAG: hypothetical protein HY666_06300 [Chloroflexi bacterium]|nr:hypothetical protein [Chloroflexota bacterium]
MPNTYKKNKFNEPKFIETTILDSNGAVVGAIRVKPSTILWRPKGEHQYFSIGLDIFTDWITHSQTGSHRIRG